jgi:hypothetical protein
MLAENSRPFSAPVERELSESIFNLDAIAIDLDS